MLMADDCQVDNGAGGECQVDYAVIEELKSQAGHQMPSAKESEHLC